MNIRLGVVLLLLLAFTQVYAKDSVSAAKILRCRSMLKTFLQGTVPKRSPELNKSIAQIEKEIEGLNYGGVVPWKISEVEGLNRNLVRYHDVEELGLPVPKFDKSQKLGSAVVDAKEIRFSQISAQNDSEGGYTVINNAKALKAGTLKVTDLPKLRVWRDEDGKIWTLDHRRLAAMRLSGAVDNIEVEFVPEAVVKEQRFKFSTQTDGKSIMINFKQPEDRENVAIVLMSEDFKDMAAATSSHTRLPDYPERLIPPKTDPESIKTMTSRFPATEREAWLKARGPEHIERLEGFAHEVSKSLKALEKKTADDIKDSYMSLGQVSVRSKGEDSILAKLLRKDFNAYQRGEAGIDNVKKVAAAIGDGLGTRIIMKTGPDGKIAPETVQAFVDQISKDIKNGTRVTEIINYRVLGKEGIPYLSDKQIDQIVRADREYRLALQKQKDAGKAVTVPEPIIVKNDPKTGYENGYTSFHMNVLYKSGVQGELQLRGPAIHQVSEVKHLFYDIRAGKVLSDDYKKNPAIVKAADSFKALSESDKAKVEIYFEQQMTHARRIEVGEKTAPPRLPAGIPAELSYENLKPLLVHD
ncbi:hypothetical protein ACJVC5_08300 [Peredibacter sp. HCB2-198]|uniref:hypothetical protein n=1 Tax=Peredibacter sp. HCB2-198 TaxID=3383025 RepID=UPI0038B4ABAC